MSGSAFYRLSGGGNDFIAFAEPERDPSPQEVQTLCRRGISLGADGLFTLERARGEMRMRYWNADGTAADLCLNGTRCAAVLAFHLGWATGQATIATGAGALTATAAEDHRIALEVPPPESRPEPLTVEVTNGSFSGWRMTIGVPHFVIFPPGDLETIAVTTTGTELRRAAVFEPAGTNVDFAHCNAPNAFDIRSYERGVEAETLACGTGVLAVAAVGIAEGLLRLPARARTRGGFTFEVEGNSRDGRVEAWSLSGDARLLAAGKLEPGATVAPS